MLNPKNKKRELAYVVEISETKELEGYQNVHYVRANGWWCVAQKELCKGDLGIYFEIDSVLPSKDKRFAFMEKKNYKVKTQKICKVLSQGLIMPITLFPEFKNLKVGDFLTDKLGVKLFEPDVRESKPNPICKNSAFQNAKDRHRKFFEFPFVKFMMRFGWFMKILKKIFIVKKDKISWPTWLVKTGSERIQNIPSILEDKNVKWIIQEKIDGMSSSYWIDKDNTYCVGSHNVVVYSSKDKDKIDDGNKYIKNNVWFEMGEKYGIKDILIKIKKENNLKTVALQGEAFGSCIQKRAYSKKHGEQDLAIFHLWFDGKRQTVKTMIEVCEKYNLSHVGVYDWNYELPDSVEELINDIDSRVSNIDGGKIEGFVIYSQDGTLNYKCVSPSYLLKYH